MKALWRNPDYAEDTEGRPAYVFLRIEENDGGEIERVGIGVRLLQEIAAENRALEKPNWRSRIFQAVVALSWFGLLALAANTLWEWLR